MRNIADVLSFRQDISLFLVHLTRSFDGIPADERLTRILDARQLRPGETLVSDVKYGGNTMAMTDAQKRGFFSAICFTETPIGEAHCLLEIEARAVNLEPYGLVFLKDRLKTRHVSPVLYLNND